MRAHPPGLPFFRKRRNTESLNDISELSESFIGSFSSSNAAMSQASARMRAEPAPRIILAIRGWQGRAAMRFPVGVITPSSVMPPSITSSACALATLLLGGSVSQGMLMMSVSPNEAMLRSVGARSASSISACLCSSMCVSAAFVQRRIHVPSATRPARPARCSAMSRLTVVTSRWVRPVRGSKTGLRYRPVSTTVLTPSMVSDVSAIGVASTTFRSPSFDGAMARCCSEGERLP